MLRIGDFSKMAKITIKALRYYDDEGLLKPAEIDKFTGYRLYTTNQLAEVHILQSLRQLGVSIAEIKLIFWSNVKATATHPQKNTLNINKSADISVKNV